MANLPLRDAFTARAIGFNWGRYQATRGEAPYLGRSKFGTRKQRGLDLKYITGKDGLPVSLKASNFDAQAELRDAIGFSERQNSMPFFRESYMVTEQEEQDYDSYIGSTSNEYANQVLARIMKKPLDLVRGAQVVPERMIWQLLAPTDGIPKVSVNIKGETFNIDYLTNTEATEYTQKHFIDLTNSEAQNGWADAATATPLADLRKIKRDFVKNDGYSLTRFSMNTETFEMLLNAEDTKKQVLGITAYNGGIAVTETAVAQYLRGMGVEIETYDKVYKDENGNTQYFIPTGIISAQSAGVYLGEFVFGTTPEERSGNQASGNLSIVETGISIYTYTKEHPVNTHCVVSMIGLPTFEGIDACATIKVAKASV